MNLCPGVPVDPEDDDLWSADGGTMIKKALSFAAVVLVVLSCARNPVTGRNQFVLMSEEQELAMGKEYAQQILQQMAPYPDPELQQYVARIGMQLAKKSERPDIPWQFHVIDDPTVNAFALPGGPVFITRGILSHMNSEAELAGVLGHEIGHVTARHSVAQISNAQLAQLGLGLGSVFVPALQGALGQLAGAGMQLLLMSHGRDAEREADQLGFNYAVENKYDVRAMSSMFTTLTRVSEIGGGGGKLPEWLSTHPNPENRVAANERRIQKASVNVVNATLNRDGYLKLVDGMVHGEDPRQGFFQDELFLHPGLKFQLRFPNGWKTQNTPSAVAAVSPAEDAIIILGAGGKESPQALLQKFLAQEGLVPGQLSSPSVNGQPGAASTFQAQTQQGAIEGMITFFPHAGSTFQLLSYTKQGGLGSYGRTFENALDSFTTLTDPGALSVQPAKLELVTVPRDMSVAEFHSQFPSNAKVEEVVIINGLATDGRFKAGQTAKRVVGGLKPQS